MDAPGKNAKCRWRADASFGLLCRLSTPRATITLTAATGERNHPNGLYADARGKRGRSPGPPGYGDHKWDARQAKHDDRTAAEQAEEAAQQAEDAVRVRDRDAAFRAQGIANAAAEKAADAARTAEEHADIGRDIYRESGRPAPGEDDEYDFPSQYVFDKCWATGPEIAQAENESDEAQDYSRRASEAARRAADAVRRLAL
jgi:hypothetical protein